jgi:hypothetical protein
VGSIASAAPSGYRRAAIGYFAQQPKDAASGALISRKLPVGSKEVVTSQPLLSASLCRSAGLAP